MWYVSAIQFSRNEVDRLFLLNQKSINLSHNLNFVSWAMNQYHSIAGMLLRSPNSIFERDSTLGASVYV